MQLHALGRGFPLGRIAILRAGGDGVHVFCNSFAHQQPPVRPGGMPIRIGGGIDDVAYRLGVQVGQSKGVGRPSGGSGAQDGEVVYGERARQSVLVDHPVPHGGAGQQHRKRLIHCLRGGAVCRVVADAAQGQRAADDQYGGTGTQENATLHFRMLSDGLGQGTRAT